MVFWVLLGALPVLIVAYVLLVRRRPPK